MEPNNDSIDAQRYRAFRWLLCASDEQQEALRELLEPMLDDGGEPTPAQFDEVLDTLAAHLAAQ